MTRRVRPTSVVVNAAAAGLPPGSVGGQDTTSLIIVGAISVLALGTGLIVGKRIAKRRA
jgi:LPXTG-motif cell wall-anchored protein